MFVKGQRVLLGAQPCYFPANSAYYTALILLSRIDGDAPRALKHLLRAFWIVREQADFNFRSRSLRASEHGPSLLPFDRSTSDS